MTEEPRRDEESAEQVPPQDTFRKVYLGQLSDPLVPAPPRPGETPEDELTRMALEDPMATEPIPSGGPTLWRSLALVVLAVFALALVFWWR
ncbi:MAG TPA: hypothetical protein PLA48_09330 [Holophaga sp.]|nr:hypothetical protein [Holophaga sp.]